ncbi:MAG: aminotransferase class V-fold PLP-dependent enzyme [Abditibacteriaceae bacterium]
MTTATAINPKELAINGGTKAVTNFEGHEEPKVGVDEFLALAKRFGFKPDAIERVAATISNDDLEGNGPNLGTYLTSFPAPSSGSQYEAKARELFDSPFALAISSGTGALHSAMVAVGAKSGKEVIVPAIGFLATSAAVALSGATPVFCDVDESLQLDPTQLEACITPNTVAVVPTHHWGMVADMDPILEIAHRHNLKVIEDCAQSPGAQYKGRYVGTLGDFGCFSISAYKIIGGGEGGLLLARDEHLFDRANQLAECGGLWRKNRFSPARYEGELFIGTNYRMSELESTVDLVQLGKLTGVVERNRTNYLRITSQLESFAEIVPQKVNDRDGLIGYQLRFFPETHELREQLTNALQAEGIPCGSRGLSSGPDWHLCSEMLPVIDTFGAVTRYDQCPVGTDLYRREISVSIDQWWTERDCDAIAAGLNKVFNVYCTADENATPWLP